MRISDWSSDVCSSDLGHALRLVGYMLSDGGYIDNPLCGQTDVNRVDTRGGRGTFRFDAGDGWTVDIGGVYQAITSHDEQYADKDAQPLTRHSMDEQNRSEVHTSALQSPMRITFPVFCLKK